MCLFLEHGMKEQKCANIFYLENAVHDLKTPLSVIESIAQYLEQYNASASEVKLLASKIRSSVRSVKSILDESADYQMLSRNAKNIDIVACLREFIDNSSALAERRNIRLDFKSDCREKYIAIDRLALERVLLNLISNSVRFSPEFSKVEVMLIDLYDSVLIEVRDEGIGVPDDMLHSIFDRYVCLDKTCSGSGIGLAIVQNTVSLFGGEVIAKNRTDRSGLSVIVELPVRVVSY